MKINMLIPEKSGGITNYSKRICSKVQTDEYKFGQINYLETTSSNPLYWYSLGRKANSDADIVHLQFEYGVFGNFMGVIPGIMLPLTLLPIKKPVVTTIHTLEMEVEGETFFSRLRGKIRKIIQVGIERYLYSRSDLIISHAPQAEEHLSQRGIPRDKVKTFPEGIEQKRTLEDSEAKENLGLDPDQSTIGIFGYVRPTKNIEKLLEALNHFENLNLVIAGGTRTESQESYLSHLKNIIEEENLGERVLHTGYVEDNEMPEVMGAIDLMVLPYDEITWSGVFAICMEHKVPILSSDLPYFRELKSRWGVVDTFSNTQNLYSKIDDMLNQRSEYQENISKYHEQNNWEKAADKFRQTYQRIKR